MYKSESAEMYLETILILRTQRPEVRSIDIARYTNYSKPSVSRAVHLLQERGDITVDEAGLIFLTEQGTLRATKVLERHQTLTRLLVTMGVDIQTADEDACRIEHVISDVSMEKIKQFLAK